MFVHKCPPSILPIFFVFLYCGMAQVLFISFFLFFAYQGLFLIITKEEKSGFKKDK